MELPENDPCVYEQFSRFRFHTVRKSEWVGWSDNRAGANVIIEE